MQRATFLLFVALAAPAAAGEPGNARLCQGVLALANAGTLADALVAPMPATEADAELWDRVGDRAEGVVTGSWSLRDSRDRPVQLLQLMAGGSCSWRAIAFADGRIASFEPLLEVEETYNVDVVPLLLGGELLLVGVQRDRWRFEPVSVARIANDEVVPLCRFEATGEVNRFPDGDDAACTALHDGRVADVDWTLVENDDDKPVSAVLPEEAARADLDWFGDGRPQATWRIDYQSGAGCGMAYRFLALADPLAEERGVDESTAAGSALFPTVEGERMPRGPWVLDRVFTHAGRAWFAGQPQWGTTKVGDFAVYRVDPDGVHVQCRYRHVPQYVVR